jgi:hypothetical protein
MPPILFGSLGATGGGIVAGQLGERLLQRFTQPFDSYFGARDAVANYMASLDAWWDNPVLLPSLDTLLELENRGILKEDGHFRSALFGAIRNHGVYSVYERPGLNATQRNAARLWTGAQELKRTVCDPASIMAAWVRDLKTRNEAYDLMERAGGNFEELAKLEEAMFGRPGVSETLHALIHDRISPDDASILLTHAGSRERLWQSILPSLYNLPSAGEFLLARNRGIIDDEGLAKSLKNLGMRDEWIFDFYDRLRLQIPGISDLLRMGSRLLFTPDVAGTYGLYDGFQEQSRPYFRQLGLDYPLGFQIPVDGVWREATLPDLYWGATREILPLNTAYIAYQRLRDTQINRYRDETPNLRPFTLDDLRLHMRVAGYPPPMQDYLIALSHPPLGRRDIQWGLQYGGKDRQWAYAQYLNLGLRPDNASEVTDTQVARVAAKETAWIDSLIASTRKKTVTEIEGMYDDGILTRAQALLQLTDAELPAQLSNQLLDLSDATRARGLLRAAVTATGRDYLSGALSTEETGAALGSYGIQPPRVGELLQIWTIRRSRHRRQADTSRILKWMGQGRISADEARRRLANLGWSDPDTILLLAEAESNLDKLRAREQKQAQADEAKRVRELDRLAKQAEAEAKRLIAERNRIAPRGVWTKWLIDGIVSQDEFRQAMRERNYPDDMIDDYIRDALRPKPPKPRVAPAQPQWPRPTGSAHPAVGVLKKWLKDQVINIDQYAEALRELGYGPDDIERFVSDAGGKPAGNGAPPQP